MIGVYIISGIVLLVGTIIIVSYRMERARTAELQQLANDLGFDFEAVGGPLLTNGLDGFHLFSQGHSRRSANAMRGRTRDLDVAVFEYQYTTGSGKHRHTWQQTVIAFTVPGANLPTFSLRPENVWHKIGAWFGYNDIDFETHPRFSRQYLLRGAPELAIRELFTERVLEYFEDNPGLSAEGAGDRLVVYRAARIKPQEIRAFMERAFEVLALFQPSAGTK